MFVSVDTHGNAVPEELEQSMWRENGLVYVGDMALKDTGGFKPVYDYDVERRLDVTPPGGHDDIAGFPEFWPFLKAAATGKLDKHLALQLSCSSTDGHQSDGTAVPLTPLKGNSMQALTAKHVITSKLRICTVAHTYVEPRKNITFEDILVARDVTPNLPAGLQSLGKSVLSPSSPAGFNISLRDVDVGLLNVSWSGSQQLKDFYVPKPGMPEAGQNVVLLAYHGNPDDQWKQQCLIKPEEFHTAAYPSSARLAEDRYWALRGKVIHPFTFTAAPGTIHMANEFVVEHTCSVVPGTSGGAGVDLHEPWRLLFIHVASHVNPHRPCSYGVSVQHPAFAYTYMKGTLPFLTEVLSLRPEKVQAIHEYVNHFQQHWTSWDVADDVAAFKAAHPVN